jgi:hypothetical protein
MSERFRNILPPIATTAARKSSTPICSPRYASDETRQEDVELELILYACSHSADHGI